MCKKHQTSVFIDNNQYYCLQCFLENEELKSEIENYEFG